MPPEYHSWQSAKNRCYTPDYANYEYYGGRGITMSDRWRNDFVAFYEDMGPRPPGTSLDRIDPNGNYEPGNCRWADKWVQARNRRPSLKQRFYEYNGETKNISQWAQATGIKYKTLQGRLDKGMSIEDALTTPISERHRRMTDSIRSRKAA